MDSQDLQVLGAVRRWQREGHRYALFTVVRTWGSAPRQPGSWMALRDDGLVQGSVSGGCIEDDLIHRRARGEFAGQRPAVLRYGLTADEAHRFGLPCGGTLELVMEPAADITVLDELASRIHAGRLVRREVDLASGASRLSDGHRDDRVDWDGSRLITPHGPAWRLLIIGAGETSRHLAQMAQALDYQVLVCDPRSEYRDEWQIAGTTLVPGMPDDAVLALELDPHSAVVALTHDPKLDDMALLEALKSPAFYVGALGSKLNTSKRKERLLQYFDLSAAEVERLHGPVGLPINSRTPAEIAVAVLAELIAVRNGAQAKRHADSPAETPATVRP